MRQAEYYRQSGADVIDLGCSLDRKFDDVGAGRGPPEERRASPSASTRSIRSRSSPATGPGIDYVLSLNGQNLDVAARIRATPVLIPDSPAELDTLDRSMAHARDARAPLHPRPGDRARRLRFRGGARPLRPGPGAPPRRRDADGDRQHHGADRRGHDRDERAPDRVLPGARHPPRPHDRGDPVGAGRGARGRRGAPPHARGAPARRRSRSTSTTGCSRSRTPRPKYYTEAELRELHRAITDPNFRIATTRDAICVFNNRLFVMRNGHPGPLRAARRRGSRPRLLPRQGAHEGAPGAPPREDLRAGAAAPLGIPDAGARGHAPPPRADRRAPTFAKTPRRRSPRRPALEPATLTRSGEHDAATPPPIHLAVGRPRPRIPAECAALASASNRAGGRHAPDSQAERRAIDATRGARYGASERGCSSWAGCSRSEGATWSSPRRWRMPRRPDPSTWRRLPSTWCRGRCTGGADTDTAGGADAGRGRSANVAAFLEGGRERPLRFAVLAVLVGAVARNPCTSSTSGRPATRPHAAFPCASSRPRPAAPEWSRGDADAPGRARLRTRVVGLRDAGRRVRRKDRGDQRAEQKDQREACPTLCTRICGVGLEGVSRRAPAAASLLPTAPSAPPPSSPPGGGHEEAAPAARPRPATRAPSTGSSPTTQARTRC